MKILRLYNNLPLKGGMEKHIYYLSNIQSKKHDVIVFYNQGDQITKNDVQVLSNFKLNKLKPQFLCVLLFHISSILKLFKNDLKFDVVHVHGDWSTLLISIIRKITNPRCCCFFNS